jgi:hypothetical protein
MESREFLLWFDGIGKLSAEQRANSTESRTHFADSPSVKL